VLRGPPIFTGKDVVDAELVDSADVGILVSLSDEAGQRLQGATRAHRGGRLAIVLDGAVESAPVVRSEIAGGQVVISLGSTSPAARDQAELLVGALGGRAFRFP
jgi:preprotein translocase subunit SecD